MKTKTRILLLSLTLLAIVSAAFAFGRSNDRADAARRLTPLPTLASGTGAITNASLPVLPAPDTSDVDVAVLLLTIRPTGFEPREVTLPAGDYVLVLRNRSGLDEFGVRLAREAGENLREARMPRYKRDWKHFLKLTPGNYVVTETDNPDWTCRITITAR